MNLLENYLARYRQTSNQGEKSESVQEAIKEVPTTTKLQHEAVCPDGPGVCGFSTWRFCPVTRELEWYCRAKTEWCWRSEITT